MRLKGNMIRGMASVSCAFALAIGVAGSAIAAPEKYYIEDGFGNEDGYAVWNDDPSGSNPGDSIRACDIASDGWWVEVYLDTNRNGFLDSNDRVASTRGLTAGQCSAWASGDLPEHQTYEAWAGMFKSGYGEGSNIRFLAKT